MDNYNSPKQHSPVKWESCTHFAIALAGPSGRFMLKEKSKWWLGTKSRKKPSVCCGINFMVSPNRISVLRKLVVCGWKCVFFADVVIDLKLNHNAHGNQTAICCYFQSISSPYVFYHILVLTRCTKLLGFLYISRGIINQTHDITTNWLRMVCLAAYAISTRS